MKDPSQRYSIFIYSYLLFLSYYNFLAVHKACWCSKVEDYQILKVPSLLAVLKLIFKLLYELGRGPYIHCAPVCFVVKTKHCVTAQTIC